MRKIFIDYCLKMKTTPIKIKKENIIFSLSLKKLSFKKVILYIENIIIHIVT